MEIIQIVIAGLILIVAIVNLIFRDRKKRKKIKKLKENVKQLTKDIEDLKGEVTELKIIKDKESIIKRFISTTSFTLIITLIGLLASVITVISFISQKENDLSDVVGISIRDQRESINTIEKYKAEMYNYDQNVKQLTNFLDSIDVVTPNNEIRRKVKELRNQTELKTFYGVINSEDDNPIADVKISIIGGSLKYSNSNGEFIINCKSGNVIRFEKHGFESIEFDINEKHLLNYQRIKLEKQ